MAATIFIYLSSQSIVRYTDRIKRLFVTKFYRDRKDRNFLKGLVYVGEKPEIDIIGFNQVPVLGRKLYDYQINKNDKNLIKPIEINSKDLDWPFPEKFYESIGFTVSGFSFEFKNSLNEALFHVNKKNIEEKIAEYIPTKNFINKSYFLYDKSNLIKKHLLQQSINNCLFMVHLAIFQEKQLQ